MGIDYNYKAVDLVRVLCLCIGSLEEYGIKIKKLSIPKGALHSLKKQLIYSPKSEGELSTILGIEIEEV